MHFEAPEDYNLPRDPSNAIQLAVRVFYGHSKYPNPPWHENKFHLLRKPYYVYLCGGPGTNNNHRKVTRFIDRALNNGFQVLFMDYRGTGESCNITKKLLKTKESVEHQAAYARLFLQGNIVRDLEAIRLCLSELAPTWNGEVKWILHGQSYGGWMALTYLSFLHKSLHRVHLTGAFPPIGRSPDDVYEDTYTTMVQKNIDYYKAFPADIDRVRRLAAHILEREKQQAIQLPAGGLLTFQQFLCLGRGFVSKRGMRITHDLIEKLAMVLLGEENPKYHHLSTREVLHEVERAGMGFNHRPMYALIHEAIYCDKPGRIANWAALRVGKKYRLDTYKRAAMANLGYEQSARGIDEDIKDLEARPFHWLDGDYLKRSVDQTKKLCFSGEMVYPFHYTNYSGLRNIVLASSGRITNELKLVADNIMSHSAWDELYDREQLMRTTVPVCAITYKKDFCVSYRYSLETARMINMAAMRHHVAEDWPHTALKEEDWADLVLNKLAEMGGGDVKASDYLSL